MWINRFEMSEEEHQSAERQSFLELTRSIAGLPLDQAAAVLETSAAIASISLRAGIEFLRAAPAAAHILQPAELRSWGEMGRRLAMADYESAASFFAEGVETLAKYSARASTLDLRFVFTADGSLNCCRTRNSSVTSSI